MTYRRLTVSMSMYVFKIFWSCDNAPKMIDNRFPVVQMPDSLDNDPRASPASVLESLTMYGELSAARTPEEFALVRSRFQREWTFNGGFVSRFTVKCCF
jgi:hypothetical protein